MPGGPLRLPWAVIDLAHLVHVHEGVQGGQVHASEGTADGEALALQAGGGGGHRHHWTLGRLRAWF